MEFFSENYSIDIFVSKNIYVSASQLLPSKINFKNYYDSNRFMIWKVMSQKRRIWTTFNKALAEVAVNNT